MYILPAAIIAILDERDEEDDLNCVCVCLRVCVRSDVIRFQIFTHVCLIQIHIKNNFVKSSLLLFEGIVNNVCDG